MTNPFTVGQQQNILRRNLGDIICDNTNIANVRDNVFMAGSAPLRCGDHAKLDIDLFLP